MAVDGPRIADSEHPVANSQIRFNWFHGLSSLSNSKDFAANH
jgi:hypothetical protein